MIEGICTLHKSNFQGRPVRRHPSCPRHRLPARYKAGTASSTEGWTQYSMYQQSTTQVNTKQLINESRAFMAPIPL